MLSPEFYAIRSRVANLTKYRESDDPELLEARKVMQQQILVDSIATAIQKVPSITDETRQRVIGLLTAA